MRASGFEPIPQWGVKLGLKVDALGEKFDAIHTELTRRVDVQRKVIQLAKMLAPAAVAYLAGRYPDLREPLSRLLALFAGG